MNRVQALDERLAAAWRDIEEKQAAAADARRQYSEQLAKTGQADPQACGQAKAELNSAMSLHRDLTLARPAAIRHDSYDRMVANRDEAARLAEIEGTTGEKLQKSLTKILKQAEDYAKAKQSSRGAVERMRKAAIAAGAVPEKVDRPSLNNEHLRKGIGALLAKI